MIEKLLSQGLLKKENEIIFTRLPSITQADGGVNGSASVALDDESICIVGSNSLYSRGFRYIYNTRTRQHSKLSNALSNTDYPNAFVHDGGLYVFTSDSKLSLYSITTHAASSKAQFPDVYGFRFVRGSYKNGRFYIYSGETNTSPKTLYSYDILLDIWTKIDVLGDIPNHMNQHVSCIYNNQYHLFGGFINGIDQDTHYTIDLVTGVSELKSTVLPANRIHCGVLIDNECFLIGGTASTFGKVNVDTLIYTDLSDKVPPEFNLNRTLASCTVIGRKIYVAGGQVGFQNELWEIAV